MHEDPYQPVSCSFYSKLELYALRKRKLEIQYLEHEKTIAKTITIMTLRTRKKVEYLITDQLQEIRLDRIISLQSVT